MKWLREGSLVAWPFEWQRPNKTEEWAYEFCKSSLRYDPLAQVVCFPWATLIDARRRNNSQKIRILEDALHELPPRMTIRRITVMQHIWSKDMVDCLEQLCITDVYWAHACIGELFWGNGIRVHPFPLYPVIPGVSAEPSKTRPINRRKLTYSFVGTYKHDLYLTKVRSWIYDLPVSSDAIVIRRPEWHYEKPVYDEHLAGIPETAESASIRNDRALEYKSILEDSVFSLCPSGSGPNSIRLWESIALGAIPVIISQNLRLAGDYANWAKAAVFIDEFQSNVQSLPTLLDELRKCPKTISGMRAAGERVWGELFLKNPFSQKIAGRFERLYEESHVS